MRRTRHVVLPVRSWQYVGLMVVSLACLTLGLVSRDREGKSGSLTGPELKHTASHKIDACPNDYLMISQSQNTDDTATRQIDNERRTLERPTRVAQFVRSSLKDERPSRIRNSRSISRGDMKAREDERRSVSLDRRHLEASRLHRVRNGRSLDAFRSSERHAQESTDRMSSEINTRRIQFEKRVSTIERQKQLSREMKTSNLRSQEHRSLAKQRDRRNTIKRQDSSRNIDMRREIIRLEEYTSLNKQMERRERIQDIRQENRHRSNDRLNERASAERKQIRAVETHNIRSESRTNKADFSRRNVRVSRAVNLNHRLLGERRNSITERLWSQSDDRTNHQNSNSRRTNGYLIIGKEFPSIKSAISNGSYEFIRQLFLLALCTAYAASILRRKSGFIGNVLPQINRLLVW